jgi:hypothetical protein
VIPRLVILGGNAYCLGADGQLLSAPIWTSCHIDPSEWYEVEANCEGIEQVETARRLLTTPDTETCAHDWNQTEGEADENGTRIYCLNCGADGDA